MKDGVETFDAWHRDASLLCELQRRPKVSLDLHRTLGFEVEPHSAVVLLWLCHASKSRFPKVGCKSAILCSGKGDQFVQHSGDERTNTNLLDEFSVIWRFEYDTSGVEGDWTATC